MKTKVIFLGSRPLALRCLQFLQSLNVEIVGVVTFDKGHKGWWNIDIAGEVEKMGLPLKTQDDLKYLDFDLLISVLYFRILTPELIKKPKMGCVNLHQAPLPYYRGCNSISHAIRDGRAERKNEYGTTFHYITPGIDDGPIIKVRWFPMYQNDTGATLYQRTEDNSYELFQEVMPKLLSGEITQKNAIRQDSIDVSNARLHYYPRTSLENKEIDVNFWCKMRSVNEIYDFVRSIEFPPFEPAYLMLEGRKFYLTTKPYGGLLPPTKKKKTANVWSKEDKYAGFGFADW